MTFMHLPFNEMLDRRPNSRRVTMIAKIIEFIKNSYKGVLSVVGVLGVIAFLSAFPAHFATSADLEKLKSESAASVAATDVRLKQEILQLKKSMELDRDITRLNQVNDSLIKAKIQQRNYPKDNDIAEDVESLKADRVKLQERIEKR